ncbi:response regulator [Achromobacter sp.]|uniref:response regulator transcription factor n=1 Tax=Achromobacter sp. TaxID=134375 RepID=UPI0028A72C32|nr:response regulator [Achromobacter sp.]
MPVLIVDDDRASAQLTAECLKMDSEVTVQIACDGAGALRTAREFAPDAVLLDVKLSDVSGLDLAAQLKAACPEIPARIIIFSGSLPDREPSLLPEGVDAWLIKPAHLSTLFKCIYASARSKKDEAPD